MSIDLPPQTTNHVEFELPLYSPEPEVSESDRPSIEIGIGEKVIDLMQSHARADNPAIINVQSA